MKHTYLIMLVMAYAVTSHVNANNIIKLTDSNIFKESQTRLKQQNLTIDIDSTNQINQHLNQVENKIDKIVATENVLKQLQQISPTQEQQNWVKQQAQATEILYIENIDHPNQKIELVNIAKQANATLHLWQVNQTAIEFKQAWQRGEWIKKDNLPDSVYYQAIAKAMESASEQQLNWLVNEVENLPAEQVSNRLIAIISRFQSEPNLINKVWAKPADEYSYQLLQQVPMLLDPASAIKLLQQASTNKKLSSQALMLLTKHFADEDASQQFVLKQLQNKDNQWHAAMAARQITDKAFQQAIKQLAIDKPSSAVLAVAKYHREAM